MHVSKLKTRSLDGRLRQWVSLSDVGVWIFRRLVGGNRLLAHHGRKSSRLRLRNASEQLSVLLLEAQLENLHLAQEVSDFLPSPLSFLFHALDKAAR